MFAGNLEISIAAVRYCFDSRGFCRSFLSSGCKIILVESDILGDPLCSDTDLDWAVGKNSTSNRFLNNLI